MSNETQRIEWLIRRHRHSGVLLDANLLILLLIGQLDHRYVARFHKTKSYSVADYRVLLQFLGQFERIIVTPHILAEASNLAGRMPGDRRYNCFQILAALLRNVMAPLVIDEQHRPARLLTGEPAFNRLGLTDAGILHRAAHRHYLVLTDDAPLGEALSERGIDFITLADLSATASP